MASKFARISRKNKLLAIGAGTAALVLGSAGAAFAEGSFTSSVDQVQPTFASRGWADLGNDSAHTVVYLTSCKGNKGGAAPSSAFITSVGVALYTNSTYDGTITKKCGAYDFGKRGGSGNTYHFVIDSINGYTSADRQAFLDAGVEVDY